MSAGMRRVKKLETEGSLTPKQTILLWLQEAHAFNNIEDYVRHLKNQPDGAGPIDRLTAQVEEAVKQTLKGKPREEIDKAVRQAYRDVLFLFYLHKQVNGKLLSENRYYWTKWLLLSKELQSLIREQDLERQMQWNRIRTAIRTPYPLDQETAAAVEAARQHHVIPWEVLEEGDELDEWLKASFLAEGKTALPNGAYGLVSHHDHLYSNVPAEGEVKDMFQDDDCFQKFLDGEDYSYGLADVPDVEYDAHYEAIVEAMKDVIQPGKILYLPNVPHQFLKETPLFEGEWIDRYTVELAEWGARIKEKGFLLEEPKDNHPLAWYRITDPANGSEVDPAVSTKLWAQTRKHLAAFRGRTSAIDERPYLSFEDYLKWRGRRNRGDIKSGMRTGMVVADWNQWVEEHGGEGEAALAKVKVVRLVCHLEGYRHRVCRDAGELAEEASLRESLLESLQIGQPASRDYDRFRQRVEHWKESALGFLSEVYIRHTAMGSISQRYFDGQQPSFPNMAEGFDQLMALLEKLVDFYNEDLADGIGRVDKLMNEAGEGRQPSPLTLDLAGLWESVQGVAKEQVAYMVDMAKADALDLLGETRQASELVERHV